MLIEGLAVYGIVRMVIDGVSLVTWLRNRQPPVAPLPRSRAPVVADAGNVNEFLRRAAVPAQTRPDPIRPEPPPNRGRREPTEVTDFEVVFRGRTERYD